MSKKGLMDQIPTKYEVIAKRAWQEFSDAADYIWKSPRLIESERKREREKLEAYHPHGGETATCRSLSEEKKLNDVFPYIIAAGNFYHLLSRFEFYLALLCVQLEKDTEKRLDRKRGNGISDWFKYLEKNRICLKQIETYVQIDAARQIRNCLIHNGGMLKWSTDPDELRKIQKDQLYRAKADRDECKDVEKSPAEVEIELTKDGERLKIDNSYAYMLARDLREFFTEVCRQAAEIAQN